MWNDDEYRGEPGDFEALKPGLQHLQDSSMGLTAGLSSMDFLGLAGNIAGGVMGMAGQASANATNAAIADKQMAFQQMMSNTAYQRQMADMRAAGVNPMLAIMKSGGASTPSGASATMENVMEPLQSGIRDTVAAAQTARRIENENKLLSENLKNISEDTRSKRIQNDINEATAKTTVADRKYGVIAPLARNIRDSWREIQKPSSGSILESFYKKISNSAKSLRDAVKGVFPQFVPSQKALDNDPVYRKKR